MQKTDPPRTFTSIPSLLDHLSKICMMLYWGKHARGSIFCMILQHECLVTLTLYKTHSDDKVFVFIGRRKMLVISSIMRSSSSTQHLQLDLLWRRWSVDSISKDHIWRWDRQIISSRLEAHLQVVPSTAKRIKDFYAGIVLKQTTYKL